MLPKGLEEMEDHGILRQPCYTNKGEQMKINLVSFGLHERIVEEERVFMPVSVTRKGSSLMVAEFCYCDYNQKAFLELVLLPSSVMDTHGLVIGLNIVRSNHHEQIPVVRLIDEYSHVEFANVELSRNLFPRGPDSNDDDDDYISAEDDDEYEPDDDDEGR